MTWMTVKMITINTTFWLAVCFGMAYFVRVLPDSWYIADGWFFKEKPFERKLYRVIRVSKWKDKLPEWGKLLSFEKKHLSKEMDLVYINRFIRETCYAESGHLGMAILGFASLLVNPKSYAMMAFIMAIINVAVQIPFIFIQRYNRPRLLVLKALYDKKHNIPRREG